MFSKIIFDHLDKNQFFRILESLIGKAKTFVIVENSPADLLKHFYSIDKDIRDNELIKVYPDVDNFYKLGKEDQKKLIDSLFGDHEFDKLLDDLKDKIIETKLVSKWDGTETYGAPSFNSYTILFDKETFKILEEAPWDLFKSGSYIDIALKDDNKTFLFTTAHENDLLFDESEIDLKSLDIDIEVY